MLSGYSYKFLMRVLFCKIHCPSFICFCKPSSHIYTSGPLKLENSTNAPPKLVTLPETSDDQLPGERKVIKDERKVIKEEQEEGILDEKKQHHSAENCLKSKLKKPNSDSTDLTEKQKKSVQWMDLLGKELVEIREFESSSEIEDTDYEAEDNRGCICVIL